MQKSFSSVYAQYYDLLYSDKDYKKESVQIDTIIKSHSHGAKSILDIGCGTGKHDFLLAERGYEITGIDSSIYMLDVANKKNNSPFIKFQYKDIREFIFVEKFDVVISLFHVTSYLISNEDLELAFHNIYNSLRKGGIFIFDFWYAPGILANLPEKRKKVIENNDAIIERVSDPEMDMATNTACISFSLNIKDKRNNNSYTKSEIHKVRYFYLEEMHGILNKTGFEVVDQGSNYEFSLFNQEDRYATIIAKK